MVESHTIANYGAVLGTNLGSWNHLEHLIAVPAHPVPHANRANHVSHVSHVSHANHAGAILAVIDHDTDRMFIPGILNLEDITKKIDLLIII
ncbi:MAG: hypothetical protein Satyrvirus46_5 [Satyrvirus sp.]|uniref:Uncharacterized protein n=1 Tax=Satyrvirus sp. TaxID=2487771 RepID=A0A3G5AHP6_9VIRU|nr:MAG: hypothetical protein Satyrvirus46_5 [Satyrvirus sp.]